MNLDKSLKSPQCFLGEKEAVMIKAHEITLENMYSVPSTKQVLDNYYHYVGIIRLSKSTRQNESRKEVEK